jgi:hypothetical protein
VIYQYQAKAAAYRVLLIMREIKDFPSTIGKRKNWMPSVTGALKEAKVRKVKLSH